MSIKTIALSVAITMATTATVASADSYFAFGETLQSSSTLELGTIRAEADGIVEIRTFNGGIPGTLLGTQAVTAGANSDVRVNIGRRYNLDVVAQLVIDGQIVASKDYDIK